MVDPPRMVILGTFWWILSCRFLRNTWFVPNEALHNSWCKFILSSGTIHHILLLQLNVCVNQGFRLMIDHRWLLPRNKQLVEGVWRQSSWLQGYVSTCLLGPICFLFLDGTNVFSYKNCSPLYIIVPFGNSFFQIELVQVVEHPFFCLKRWKSIFLIQYVEIPGPSLKKDEVLIKVEAASINRFDCEVQKGQLRPCFPKLPFIPGIGSFVLVQRFTEPVHHILLLDCRYFLRSPTLSIVSVLQGDE